MSMTFAEAVKAARAGHTSFNILAQVTNQVVIDDKLDVDTYGGTYQWPLLSARDGVLTIARNKHRETDDTIYYGGIQRATGLGDVFSGLLRGGQSSGAGSLDYETDDSPIMLEVADVDWANSSIEIRMDYDASGWDASSIIYNGSITDGEIKKNKLSFRVAGNAYLLAEEVDSFSWIGMPSFGTIRYAVPFGYVYSMPIMVTSEMSGSDFVYGTSAYDASNASVTIRNGDADSVTNEPHTAWGSDPNRKIVLTNSNTWTLANNYPENHLYADVNGYDEGAGFAAADTAAEILNTALPLAQTSEWNGSGYDYSAALNTFSVNYTSLATFATKNVRKMGINFYSPSNSHSIDAGTLDVTIIGLPWTWAGVFDYLIESAGGVYTIDADNSLSFHYMLAAPTETPILTIGDADFEKHDITRVPKYTYVEVTNLNSSADYGGYLGYAGTTPTVEVQSNPRTLEISVDGMQRDLTELNALASALLYRFGARDYRFKNCPIARTVNVGDVVTFTDDIDDYLDGTKKGYVIGVDRGTSPFIDIRV